MLTFRSRVSVFRWRCCAVLGGKPDGVVVVVGFWGEEVGMMGGDGDGEGRTRGCAGGEGDAVKR